jgi:hypothetical protein
MLRTRRQSATTLSDPVNSSSFNATNAVPPPCHSSSGCCPNECDILCGKDKTYFKHPGNRLFRQRIEATRCAYKTAATKQEKMRITRDIVAYFKSKLKARFLKPSVNGEWIEIRDTKARDKVSHALRFSARNDDGNNVTDGDDDNTGSTNDSSSSSSSSQKSSASPSSTSTSTSTSGSSSEKNRKANCRKRRTNTRSNSLSSADDSMSISSSASKNEKVESSSNSRSNSSSVMVGDSARLNSSSNIITSNDSIECTTTGQGEGPNHETMICPKRTTWRLSDSTASSSTGMMMMAALDCTISPLTRTSWMVEAKRTFAESVATTPTMNGTSDAHSASSSATQSNKNASENAKMSEDSSSTDKKEMWCCEQQDLDGILQEPLILDEWESFNMIENV